MNHNEDHEWSFWRNCHQWVELSNYRAIGKPVGDISKTVGMIVVFPGMIGSKWSIHMGDEFVHQARHYVPGGAPDIRGQGFYLAAAAAGRKSEAWDGGASIRGLG